MKTKKRTKTKKISKIAYFAAGCFWSVEEKFSSLRGVLNTEVGYMGGRQRKTKRRGQRKRPTYEEVLSGRTGHAETVKVVYDPKKITFPELVQFFFKIHDPTTKDRQGPDIGSQYRSIVFYSTKKEKEDYVRILQKQGNRDRIVTEVKKKTRFHKAEDYHQRYLSKKKILTENESVFRKICINNTKRAEKKYSGKYSKPEYLLKKGIYICPVCENKLYSSENMYDSKTGWPAFWDTIDGYENSSNVFFNPTTKELKCMKCGLHLGHRMFDGPTESKVHDCLNSTCLHFIEDK